MKRGLLLGIGIGIGIGNGIALSAWADQCAYVTEVQARNGAAHLKVGERVREYCEPCNDKAPSKPETIGSVTPQRVAGDPRFWELVVDGKGVDLAYLFVESKEEPGRFDNLAKLAGCPTGGVSASIGGR